MILLISKIHALSLYFSPPSLPFYVFVYLPTRSIPLFYIMKGLLYYKLYDLFCLNVSHMSLCMTWDYNKVLLREVELINLNVLLPKFIKKNSLFHN